MSNNILPLYDKRNIEKEASDWVVRFESDNAMSQEDINDFQEWASRSALHKTVICNYVSLWNEMDLLSELMLSVPSKKSKSLVGSLRKNERREASNHWGGALKRWLGVPVLLAVCVFVASNLYSNFIHYPSSNGTYITHTGETKSHTLSDGSVIWLNTNSRLEVNYNKLTRKIVLHQGEAHFQVEKNQNKAFEVYVAGKVVKAIGTAFSVYKEDQSVRVTVTEGLVDLLEPPALPEVNANVSPSLKATKTLSKLDNTLSQANSYEVLGSLGVGQSVKLPLAGPGQMDDVITLAQRELDHKLAWREGLMVFTGETLHEVVKEVSRYSQLDITISDPSIRSMRVGGQFKIGETEALLDVLEDGFGLQIVRVSSEIININGKK